MLGKGHAHSRSLTETGSCQLWSCWPALRGPSGSEGLDVRDSPAPCLPHSTPFLGPLRLFLEGSQDAPSGSLSESDQVGWARVWEGGEGRRAADGAAPTLAPSQGHRAESICFVQNCDSELFGCLYMAASQMETGKRLQHQQQCCCLPARVSDAGQMHVKEFVSPHTYAGWWVKSMLTQQHFLSSVFWSLEARTEGEQPRGPPLSEEGCNWEGVLLPHTEQYFFHSRDTLCPILLSPLLTLGLPKGQKCLRTTLHG